MRGSRLWRHCLFADGSGLSRRDQTDLRARILHVAFGEAQKRKGILHNVHKSNVLLSSVLWNQVLEEVAGDYPEVEVLHIIVDAAAFGDEVVKRLGPDA